MSHYIQIIVLKSKRVPDPLIISFWLRQIAILRLCCWADTLQSLNERNHFKDKLCLDYLEEALAITQRGRLSSWVIKLRLLAGC